MNENVICKDIYGKEYEVSANELIFRPSVYGIIIEGDKILLSRQHDGYDYPGGGINLGENIEDALVREVREETGLTVNVGKLIACENSFFRSSKGHSFQGVMLYYLCQPQSGELTTEFFDEYEQQYADMPEWIDLAHVEGVKFISTADCRRVLRETKTFFSSENELPRVEKPRK